eukprot:CAMPEP_0197543388 /NCGR_PEP_ID=MMETSP1318-20131121/68215_1 /TAXON_ID=552666 /ORGANISM="Partenskyella glossopodia, Strain RCC365" /LENGTH=313 /DNA_ID=CAMNT_0043102723 /DNA_START=319 /DNA_END=1260 /DNA_ORIENTATION=-
MCDPSGVEPCGDSYSSVSKFVAEPFSALASIGLILAGSNAMHQSRKYNFETRFMVLGFSVVVFGAISVLFHVTLNKRAQFWEEMAMLWVAFGWFCVLANMSGASNRTTSIAMVIALAFGMWISSLEMDPRILRIGSRFLLLVFSSAGVFLLNDCVKKYCNLPLLFDSQPSPRAFKLSSNRKAMRTHTHMQSNSSSNRSPHPSMLKLQLMARWHFACLAIFFSLWVTSLSTTTQSYHLELDGMSHLFIGLSCHYGLQFSMALRQSILHKAPPATSWSLGGLLGCVVPTEVPSRAMGAQLRWLLKMAGVDGIDNV